MSTLAEIQDRLAASLQEHDVPGATVAVWHEGRMVHAAAGVININTEVTVVPDAVFPVGSITKAYTATMVMQLVSTGALDLDRTVCEILPDFQLADARATASITPRQLLCHTSGIDGDLLEDVSHGADAIQKLMTRLVSLEQLHAPGAMFSYCNVGYVVLGRIVEVLTRQTWDDALARRVLKPIGATHTVTRPEEALKYRTAFGHWKNRKSGTVELAEFAFVPRSNAPAGTTLAASAPDLVRFGRAHLDGGLAPDGTRVLSPDAVRIMQECQIRTPLSSRCSGWGLGWMCFDWTGPRMFGHDGSTNGASAYLRIVPDRRLVIALTTNSGHASGVFNDVVVPLLEDLAGIRQPQWIESATPAVIDLDRYAGLFSRHGQHIDLRADGAGLSAVWGGKYVGDDIELKLVPLSAERFAARVSGASQPLGVYFLDFDSDRRPAYMHFTERAFSRCAAGFREPMSGAHA